MLFLLLFLVWPLAELFAIVAVANAIGVLDTFILLLAGVPLGTWALRSQGAAVWRRAADAVAAGRPPGRHLIDGALVVAGGTLLVIPGFITDVLGIALLLPPTRALVRALVMRNLQSAVIVRTARFGRRPGREYDVDATATDVNPRHLQP
jgi:UPF0716 protein FxsA